MPTQRTGPSRSPSPTAADVAPVAPGVTGAALPLLQSALTPRAAGRVGDSPLERPGAVPQRARPAASAEQARSTRLTETPDQELAAYFLARALHDRPVSPLSKALLQRANETKKDVLSLMRFGRANVTTDLNATRNQGFHRLLAQRHVCGSTSSLGESPQVSTARDAALSAYVGSGNCGEFANVAAHVHAGRLLEGERLVTQKASDRDHSWVLVQGAPGADGTRRRAIIDVWGEGPVIDPQDNRFITDAPSSPLTVHTIESADAAAVSRQFDEGHREPDARTVRRLGVLIEASTRAGRQPTGDVYEPRTIVSRPLQEAARAAIEGHQTELPLRAQAAALLREVAPNLPEAQEASTVDAVLDMAANLEAPRERDLDVATLKRRRASSDSE